MNSWEIIKQEMTRNSQPGTLGRSADLNQCGDLFVKLMHNLTDKEVSVESMNKDEEVREAILNRRGIEEMKKAGVLS